MATTSVIDRAVPGAGPLGDVLSTVLQLCGDMKEGKYACNSLHARLKGVLDELQTVEECGQRPGEKSLHQFVAIVSKFLRFLERHRESSLVFRLVAYDKMAEEQQQVSDDIAQLFEELGVVTVNWEEQWEHDTRIQKDVLVASAMDSATILRDLTDPRACVEAALTLKFEMQQRAEQHNGEIMECIKSMMGIIAADSRAKVTELPPWSIPSYEDPNVYVADLEDSKPVLAIDSSIPELLTTIQTGNAARCEQALLLLLQVGSDDQKENAVRALANLTMNNERSCAEITNEGAIPVLMELLGTGIGVQKGLAALTLGFLGATNKANSTVLRDAGALGLLVDLLRTEGIEQEQHAVTALEHLTAHNNENLKAVAREDVIAPLVSVLQVGSDTQKELGTVVLGRLAGTQASREKIAAEGVIPLLVGLVRTGTNAQKEEAAHVLGRLAKDETKAVIKSLGAIGILQELQQTGTTGQKRKARVALKAISEDDGGTSKRRRSAPNQTLCFSAIQKGVSMPSSPHSIEELSGGGTLGLEQGVYFIMSFANPKVGANKGVDHEAQWGYCGRDVL
ncbi:hypothetical protein PF006_g3976 [Phytophthora fragariae]|uniref:Uncharacterized protein n=1 Tax=Phytophthora fragariae TaxID=53985 RepID=A0A6A3UND2_9STRA|nr:hypothetical protein PF006_g3976 [Phytophthora fragariae]